MGNELQGLQKRYEFAMFDKLVDIAKKMNKRLSEEFLYQLKIN